MRRDEEDVRSRASSRRGSAGGGAGSTPPPLRRAAPSPRPQRDPVDFLVQGRQMRRTERANSLPVQQRRQSVDSLLSGRSRRHESRPPPSASRSRDTSLEDDLSLDLSQVSDFEDTSSKYGPKKPPLKTSTPKSFQRPRRSSLQTSPRLCLSREGRQMDSRQVDVRRDSRLFENRKVDARQMESRQSESRQSEGRTSRVDESSFDSCRTTTYSKDSLYHTSSEASTYHTLTRRDSETDNWSVSPEYSTQSSGDGSPRRSSVLYHGAVHELQPCTPPHAPSSGAAASFVSWSDREPEPAESQTEYVKKTEGGEWNHFWANYNSSLSRVPMKTYYDQCPTPYRSENFDIADLKIEESIIKSPNNIDRINQIIQKDGLYLTPRETQSLIKCTHILGSVLSKAIDRKANEIHGEEGVVEVTGKKKNENEDVIEKLKEPADLKFVSTKIDRNVAYKVSMETSGCEKEQTENMEKEHIKKSLKLELKEQNKPMEQEDKICAVKTTQTEISLPNTRSAPKIFEKILKQLSKTSIEFPMPKDNDQNEDSNSKT